MLGKLLSGAFKRAANISSNNKDNYFKNERKGEKSDTPSKERACPGIRRRALPILLEKFSFCIHLDTLFCILETKYAPRSLF
jgi:hypothetical protein